MKKYIMLCLIFLLITSFTEYNGVHLLFEVQFKDGSKQIGYKYIAHGNTTESYKAYLENNPEIILNNEYTFEPGTHGLYTKRLAYNYNEITLYKLINPIAIDTSKIKQVIIKEMITASYAIQIVGNYELEDQTWMNSKPIASYQEGEDLCIYDINIHKNSEISQQITNELFTILKYYDNKIKVKAKEMQEQINSDQDYEALMKPIYFERNQKLDVFFGENKNLKTVIVSMCSC